MSLSVLGSLALDSVETPFGREEGSLGGSASYAAIAASFFCKPKIFSVVGTDFPEEHLGLFKSRGIDISRIDSEQGKTFRWSARYPSNMDYAHTISTCLGVFEGYFPAIDSLRDGDDLLLANIDPDLQDYVLRKGDFSGVIACDTMGLWIKNKKNALLKLLRKINLFLLNDEEARQISGERDLVSCARYLSSKGADMIAIKKGEHGVLFFKDGLRAIVPAYLTQNVQDPTGAGDTFAGGMMGYLSKKKSRIDDMVLRRALVYGSIMASFAVEGFSVKGLLRADIKSVEERYRVFAGLTKF